MANAKPVNELVASDLDAHPLWYYPMDPLLPDETYVRPHEGNEIDLDTAVLVRCEFRLGAEEVLTGYINWHVCHDVGMLQPTLLHGDLQVPFWSGIGEPRAEDFDVLLTLCGDGSSTIHFRSMPVANLTPIEGELFGLYYLRRRFFGLFGRSQVACKRLDSRR